MRLIIIDVTWEPDKATRAGRDVLERYPRDTFGYSAAGIVYMAQGQYEKAEEVTRQGMRAVTGKQRAVGIAISPKTPSPCSVLAKRTRLSRKKKRKKRLMGYSIVVNTFLPSFSSVPARCRNSYPGFLPALPTSFIARSLPTPRVMAAIFANSAN